MSDEHFKDDIIAALTKERRAERRWRNIRFIFWVIIAFVILFAVFSRSKPEVVTHHPYVALVRLDGEIMEGHSFSVMNAVPALRNAFADTNSQGVLLLINSPGGSAAQASIIHDQIVALKKQYNKKVVVVGVDALASGAYLVASPADKIYVNRDTITGSIGVVMSGFGFVEAIDRLGITRRTFTSGTNKDQLDPFRPMSEADRAKIQSILSVVHQNFIDDVKQGRGSRLKAKSEELFSGAFWAGETAVKLGLVDGNGDLWSVMKDEFGVTRSKDYTQEPLLFEKIFQSIGASLHLGLLQKNTPLREQAY